MTRYQRTMELLGMLRGLLHDLAVVIAAIGVIYTLVWQRPDSQQVWSFIQALTEKATP